MFTLKLHLSSHSFPFETTWRSDELRPILTQVFIQITNKFHCKNFSVISKTISVVSVFNVTLNCNSLLSLNQDSFILSRRGEKKFALKTLLKRCFALLSYRYSAKHCETKIDDMTSWQSAVCRFFIYALWNLLSKFNFSR